MKILNLPLYGILRYWQEIDLICKFGKNGYENVVLGSKLYIVTIGVEQFFFFGDISHGEYLTIRFGAYIIPRIFDTEESPLETTEDL